MSVKITYTKGGSDPTTIVWPPFGPIQWIFTSGSPIVINELISYPGSGMITWPDGRAFQQTTSQGSIFMLGRL